DPPQLATLVGPKDERAKRALAPALALRVAHDHELLLGVRLELEPVARALPRLVARLEPLAHHALEPPLLGRGQQRRAVVERFRALHGPVAPVPPFQQPPAPLREAPVDQRLPLAL